MKRAFGLLGIFFLFALSCGIPEAQALDTVRGGTLAQPQEQSVIPDRFLRRYVEGRDNDALLYVPPPPGVAADAESGSNAAPHAKKRRRVQPQPEEEQSEEGGEPAPAPEEGEPETVEPQQESNDTEAGTNEDQQ